MWVIIEKIHFINHKNAKFSMHFQISFSNMLIYELVKHPKEQILKCNQETQIQ